MKNIAFPARKNVRFKLENFSDSPYFEIFTANNVESNYSQYLGTKEFEGSVMNHYLVSGDSQDFEYVLERAGVMTSVIDYLKGTLKSAKNDFKFRIPSIMAVANATPDSFYPGSRLDDSNKVLDSLMDAKPDIIDVGGESTRPGSVELSVEEELKRTEPVVDYIQSSSNIPVSIDTRHPEVLERFAGRVQYANDISGFRDHRMIEIAAEHSLKCVTMHMRGVPADMQTRTGYVDLVPEILAYLLQSAEDLESAGIKRDDIFIDPGIGFSKDFAGNLEILSEISSFSVGYKTLVGASRKSFIGKISGEETGGRLPGTLASTAFLATKGVDIIRVHDPAENIQLLKVLKAITEGMH